MTQRAFNLLLALAGVVAVAGMVLWGADPAAAVQGGPRWKRRLIAAGLGLLAALGLAYLAYGPVREWITDLWFLHTCYVMQRVETEAVPSVKVLEYRVGVLRWVLEADTLEPTVLREALRHVAHEIEYAQGDERAGQLSLDEQARLGEAP